MPLIHSSSESALRSNIATEIRARGEEGRAQAVAIALSVGRRAWRKNHPKGPFPHHLRRTGAYRASRSNRNRAYPISYSDGRTIADPIVMIWDDMSTERRGNWYRAHWQETLESTSGSPVFGYASGQGGPHRTQRAAAEEVWRYYPHARIYNKSRIIMKRHRDANRLLPHSARKFAPSESFSAIVRTGRSRLGMAADTVIVTYQGPSLSTARVKAKIAADQWHRPVDVIDEHWRKIATYGPGDANMAGGRSKVHHQEFAGYEFTSGPSGTVIHGKKIDFHKSGDYGADPIDDGKFRMVPSGDIVDYEERMRRLPPRKAR